MAKTNTPYEVVGDGVAVAAEFFNRIDDAQKAQFSVASELGANGFRPGRDGRMRSLMFDDLPAGYRRIGSESGRIEAVPLKTTKIGKAAAQRMAEAPQAPNTERLPEMFGWNGEWVIEGDGRVYFATASRILLPSPRYFIAMPRRAGDGIVIPGTLRELLLSEYEAAFHQHNLLAAERRTALAA